MSAQMSEEHKKLEQQLKENEAKHAQFLLSLSPAVQACIRAGEDIPSLHRLRLTLDRRFGANPDSANRYKMEISTENSKWTSDTKIQASVVLKLHLTLDKEKMLYVSRYSATDLDDALVGATSDMRTLLDNIYDLYGIRDKAVAIYTKPVHSVHSE